MNRLALVTGGIKGIGAASAIALQQAGFDVVSNYRADHLTAQQFSMTHGKPHYLGIFLILQNVKNLLTKLLEILINQYLFW